MSNDSIAPWWVHKRTRVKLSSQCVDTVIHRLEADTGRTVADRDAFCLGLENAVTYYRDAKEEYDQRPRPAQVRDEYQKLFASIGEVCCQFKRIVSNPSPLSTPLEKAAYDYDALLAGMENENDPERGCVEVACKQIEGLHVFFQAALESASREADKHPHLGRLPRGAIWHFLGRV